MSIVVGMILGALLVGAVLLFVSAGFERFDDAEALSMHRKQISDDSERLVALKNAEGFARAAQKVAEAETAGFEALARRADRMMELEIRQESRSLIRAQRLAEQRHKLELDYLHRQTALFAEHRRLLEAKHDLEGARKFKPKKFKLSEAVLDAKIADSRVEAEVARTAGNPGAWLENEPAQGVLLHLDRLIEEQLADGRDTTELHRFIDKIKKEYDASGKTKKRRSR